MSEKLNELYVYDDQLLKNDVKKITSSRIGKIVKITNGNVFVNYDENPFTEPLNAKLGRPFMLSDIEIALENIQDIRLEFIDNSPDKPVITDIYYSVLEKEKKKGLQDLHIIGRKIILEGSEEIVIKSGNAKTTYRARDGKLIEEATQIKSSAVVTNKVQGGSVSIN